MRSTTLAAACCAGAALTAAPAASAAPVVTQATGANAAAIQAAVDQYRNELGNNNAAGPPAPSGRRQIGWDGVPDLRAAPAFMPEGQFRGVGAVFTGPGTGFQVSGDDNSADAPPFDDPDQLNFSDINATYLTTFAPFSVPRLFTAAGTNVYDTVFVVPGTATTATTNGFGAVFSDVDSAGPSTMEYFAADGSSLGSFQVPATPGVATFSFLGVRFDAGERVARVRVTNGQAALAAGVQDVSAGGPSDLVVNDDFIFGEPQPLAPDTAGPRVSISGPRRARLRALRRGLRFRLTPDEAASLEVSLLGSPGQVTIARFEVVLASRTLQRATGPRTVRLRPVRRLLQDTARRFTVRLRVVATDAAGNRRVTNRSIRIRR